MSKYLFLVSIGPVQEFIASARRSRDLWFGSWILSELSKTAALTIVQQHGSAMNRLIFPAPADEEDLKPDSDFNVANKIIAEIDQEPQNLATTMKKAIDARLNQIRDSAFDRIQGSFDRNVPNKQVADLVEFLWAGVPLSDALEYKSVRVHLEALMAARKNTRTFQVVGWGDMVPKSSLDGQRESVIPESAFDTLSPENLYERYKVNQGERLCGVGLLKRLGHSGRHESFPSTSHIAAGPLLRRLKEADRASLVMHWLEYYSKLPSETKRDERISWGKPHPIIERYDGSILFEERLRDTLKNEKLRDAQKHLGVFFKNIAQVMDVSPGSLKPIPYYALLLADGDNMGKAIDYQDSPKKHRALSQALARFASDVKGIVEEQHEGALVYAGGDDVLAFVPLHTVLECANALATNFHKNMNPYPDKDGKTSTLSVGIAIAHHIEPLSDALNLARRAESEAKSVSGKNALAVVVSKRSGSETTVADTRDRLYRRLTFFSNLHQNDEIPDGAAYELRDLAIRLDIPRQDATYATLQEAMYRETLRILKRKKAQRGQRSVAETRFEQLEWELAEYIRLSSSVPLRQFADELIVARLFADARILADMPLYISKDHAQ